MPHGTFAWNELMTTDVEKAKAFFATTIGWSYEGMSIQTGGLTGWRSSMGSRLPE